LNEQRIRPSRVTELSKALAAIGFPPGVDERSPDLLAFLAAVKQCQSMRRTGSAALNLCYVAASRFDAAWSFSTNAWDSAAGALITREAGGAVTSPDGGIYALERGWFLAAATQALHAQLVSLLAQAVR
jgi:myo-inositol-1(or 4)-monophosphatase